jgi:hypothetical protein
MVASVFPLITRSAWASKSAGILKTDKTATSKSFRYKMRIRQYNKQFGKDYRHRGTFPTILSFFIRVLPKVGPLRPLRFKVPDEQAEKYFVTGFDAILRRYQDDLQKLQDFSIALENNNYDTGIPTAHCSYSLADDTYTRWLLELREDKFENLSPAIMNDLREFYKSFDSANMGNYSKKCRKVFNSIVELRAKKLLP